MKPEFNKQSGKYEVKAFGKIHEFEDRYEASCYCDEVMSFSKLPVRQITWRLLQHTDFFRTEESRKKPAEPPIPDYGDVRSSAWRAHF